MTDQPEPIRKSSLPTIPPPEWEHFTWFPHPDGGGDMVLGQRQRGVLVRRRVSYGDWEPVSPDRWADEPQSAGRAACVHPDGYEGECPCPASCGCCKVAPPVDRAALKTRIAAAMREHYLCTNRDEADGDGNLPCRCGDWREPGPMGSDEDDWDSHLADAVLAVLPAPTGQAAVLREAIDTAREEGHRLEVEVGIEAARGARCVAYLLRKRLAKEQPLRRLADEAQPAAGAQQDETRQWCKCSSCWGWFVEDHPGEDLNELGRDLGWWSGLPEHRDAPTGAEAQPASAETHSCDNCDGIDPDTCLMNPDRPRPDEAQPETDGEQQ